MSGFDPPDHGGLLQGLRINNRLDPITTPDFFGVAA
jgi:hypothetical protein